VPFGAAACLAMSCCGLSWPSCTSPISVSVAGPGTMHPIPVDLRLGLLLFGLALAPTKKKWQTSD